MRIFIQIVVSILLGWWPIVALTSVMLFGGPGSGNDPKVLRMVILVIFYPALIGAGMYFFKQSLWGIPPKWVLIATVASPIVAVFVLGYPRMLMNATAGIPNQGYFKNETAVYHRGRKIEADPKTFQIVDEADVLHKFANAMYARDKDSVFLEGRKIAGADPNTFQIIEAWRYARDAKNVYFEGKRVENIDPAKFELIPMEGLGERNYTDGTHLIHWGKVVGKIDAASVKSLGNSYVKDRSQVFYMGELIPGADPDTFNVINETSFSRDAKRVYFWQVAVPNANPKTFEILERGYAKDDQRVYHHRSIKKIDIVDGADAQNFKVTNFDDAHGSEAFDGKSYFMDGKKVAPK